MMSFAVPLHIKFIRSFFLSTAHYLSLCLIIQFEIVQSN